MSHLLQGRADPGLLDAAGEPHFTNNIMGVPEPHRSRYLEEEAQEKVKAKKGPPPKARKYDYVDVNTITRKPFKDFLPADTRREEEEAKAREGAIKAAKDGLENLKALLKKKTDEFNLASGWEMILHTPRHKQDKLRITDEIERIKAQIKDNEKKLEGISKQPPSE